MGSGVKLSFVKGIFGGHLQRSHRCSFLRPFLKNCLVLRLLCRSLFVQVGVSSRAVELKETIMVCHVLQNIQFMLGISMQPDC